MVDILLSLANYLIALLNDLENGFCISWYINGMYLRSVYKTIAHLSLNQYLFYVQVRSKHDASLDR